MNPKSISSPPPNLPAPPLSQVDMTAVGTWDARRGAAALADLASLEDVAVRE